MSGSIRTLIGAVGLLTLAVGLGGGAVVFASEFAQKIRGGGFGDGANDAIGMTVFGLLGGIAWLVADIDRRLEQGEKKRN